jgi:hypothetical protein
MWYLEAFSRIMNGTHLGNVSYNLSSYLTADLSVSIRKTSGLTLEGDHCCLWQEQCSTYEHSLWAEFRDFNVKAGGKYNDQWTWSNYFWSTKGFWTILSILGHLPPPPPPKKKNCSVLSPNNNGRSQAFSYKINSTGYPKLNFQYMKNERNFLNIVGIYVKIFQAF